MVGLGVSSQGLCIPRGWKWVEQEGISWAWGELALWLLQLQQLTQPPLALQNDRIPAISWILPLAFCCLRGKEKVSWLPSTAPTSPFSPFSTATKYAGGDCDHVTQFTALSFQDWVFYMLSQQNKYNITSKR